jgi:hypothetical protein
VDGGKPLAVSQEKERENMEGVELRRLELRRCPYCSVAKPFLDRKWHEEKINAQCSEFWAVFQCSNCQKYVLALSLGNPGANLRVWPELKAVGAAVPTPARDYLEQAIESIHAPAGAVMLAASAIDAMLREKGYRDGVLYSRIEEAEKQHLITKEMAAWAHEIRLDANDQRHADESSPLPTESDATKVVDFAQALAEFLFVLPARVERGRGKEKK